jgi:hypothetical protein
MSHTANVLQAARDQLDDLRRRHISHDPADVVHCLLTMMEVIESLADVIEANETKEK